MPDIRSLILGKEVVIMVNSELCTSVELPPVLFFQTDRALDVV